VPGGRLTYTFIIHVFWRWGWNLNSPTVEIHPNFDITWDISVAPTELRQKGNKIMIEDILSCKEKTN
jgi:hypothetical protein